LPEGIPPANGPENVQQVYNFVKDIYLHPENSNKDTKQQAKIKKALEPIMQPATSDHETLNAIENLGLSIPEVQATPLEKTITQPEKGGRPRHTKE